jgi:hypothetical protein
MGLFIVFSTRWARWRRGQKKLFWVLGIDMAHMGRRYGDEFGAQADRVQWLSDCARPRRADRVTAMILTFWNLVQEKRDDLKWCDSSPLYTRLKAVPQARRSLALEQRISTSKRREFRRDGINKADKPVEYASPTN